MDGYDEIDILKKEQKFDSRNRQLYVTLSEDNWI